MNQHPVPQNVSSYQFRLVGDMTLKQFGLLASGAVAGFIIYQLPILPLLKWPFIFISAFGGFALAFLPIEDRPLDRWLFAFLKSAYSHTQFFWHKSPVLPDYLKPTPPHPPAPADTEPQKDTAQLQTYLQTLAPQEAPTDLDRQELSLLEKIHQLFQTINPVSVSSHLLLEPDVTPKLPPIRVRKLTGLNPPLHGEIRVTSTPPQPRPKADQPLAETELTVLESILANIDR